MTLGKVVGTVVATRKEQTLEGLRFMLVRHVDAVIMAIVDTWEVGRETKYKK